MPARQRLRAPPVPVRDRLQDLLVLVGVPAHLLRRLGLQLVDRGADPRHPEVLDELQEQLVAGRLDERDVELAVRGEAAREVRDGLALAGDRVAHPLLGPGQAAFGGEPRCSRLDDEPRLVGHRHVRGVDVGHASAAVGVHLDQPLSGEPAQGLAHRRAGDAQLARKVLLVQAPATRQRPVGDLLANRRVHLIDDACHLQPGHTPQAWRMRRQSSRRPRARISPVNAATAPISPRCAALTAHIAVNAARARFRRGCAALARPGAREPAARGDSADLRQLCARRRARFAEVVARPGHAPRRSAGRL